ncbi:hypothetical protein [Nostoc sp.]|uniref:hypothetical protein n=1 Tax=Nostoc sp. TaxID=1180 RepID=UPI002FFB93A9
MDTTDAIRREMSIFTLSQTTGLASLVFLAWREKTSVWDQWSECGFADIPENTVSLCDLLSDQDQLKLAADIAIGLLKEIVAANLERENAESISVQAIEAQS